MNYRHTQIGWVILVCFAAAFVLLAATRVLLPAQEAREVPLAIIIPILLALMALFGSLTVEVEDQLVRVSFGPGLIRKTIRLAEVVSCNPVRNRWWYGWGIRRIPRGWLFNVSGLHAVELQLKNGKVYRIGTDEPRKLNEFIQARLAGTT
jgi:hypothetical protein